MTDFTRPPRFAVECSACEWRGERRNVQGRRCPACGAAGEQVRARHQAGLAPGRGRTYLLCMEWPDGWRRDPADWRYLLGPAGERIRFHAQHYTGKSFDVAARYQAYLDGQGGVGVVDAAIALGAVPLLVRTWPLPAGEDWREWKLKRRPARWKDCSNKCGRRRGVAHGMTRYCPRCTPPKLPKRTGSRIVGGGRMPREEPT